MNYYVFINYLRDSIQIFFVFFILSLFFIIFYLLKYLIIRNKKYLFYIIKKTHFYIYKKILNSKTYKRFDKNHPRIITFLKNRLDKNSFDGLPLSVLFILFLYVFIEFIGMTDTVLDQGLITQIDVRLSEFFYYFKDMRLINFFLFISYFGTSIIVFLLTFIVSLILLLKNKKFEVVGLLSSVLISSIVSTVSKIIIARPRPEYAIYNESSFSFPSFHAVISVALYGFIIWIFLVNIKKWKRRVNLIFIGIIIAFLIGFSRLYLNVHFLSDVISGWFLGFLGLLFGITISLLLKHKYKKNKGFFFSIRNLFLKYFYYKNIFNLSNRKNKKILSTVLFISFLIFSIFYYKIYYKNILFNNEIKEKYFSILNISNFFENNPHLRFTETITGRNSVPINFIFLARNDSGLINIFKKTGWSSADKLGRKSLKNMGKNLLKHKTYKTAPITPLYWNKEIQDFGFQKLPKIDTIKYRHHIRIWKTDYKIGDYYIFVGCGVYDNGLKWGITHRIDADIDKEKNYIFNSLKESNLIHDNKIISLEKNGFHGTNFTGDTFFTDGKAYILEL